MVLVGDRILDSLGPTLYPVIILLADALLCAFAYKKRSLSKSGVVMTMIVGCFVFYFLGLPGWMTLIVFFATCTVLTKIARPKSKKVADGIQKKGGCRDYMQVIANGAPATLCAILYGLTGKYIFIVLFGAAMAESNADTWAGEIGILSEVPPVMITTLQPVPPGLSGGVTILGTVGCLAGSVVIALTWYIGFSSAAIADAVVIAISGFVGGMMDSLMGATLQGHYWDTDREQITEHESRNGKKYKLVRGIKWMDNDMVNLMSNASAILMALILTIVD